jgi:hypothetical protein
MGMSKNDNQGHTEYRVGDWLFCEFNLQQIKEMRGNNITTVTDGFFSLSSSSLNDRCFPLEKRVKVISDGFDEWSKRIHREGHRSLNFPAINQWLIKKWRELCLARDDDDVLEKGIREVDEWCSNLLSRSKELLSETIGGIKMFS